MMIKVKKSKTLPKVNKNDDEDKVKAASEEFKTLKKSKTLPKVNKNDDEDKVKAASEEFKTLKKSLKTVYDVQKKRLKIALINGRKWTVDLWNNVFVNNPLMSRFANSIVWGVYENDKLIDTFRYGEMEHLIL